MNEEGFESWDSDPDFQFPPSGLLLPASNSSSSGLALDSSRPPASEDDHKEGQEREGENFFSLLDSKLNEKGKRKEREREKGDSLNSLRSVGTDSTVSSSGTLRGVNLADLSLDDEITTTTSEEKSGGNGKMQTIRLGSELSKLLSSKPGVTGTGTGTEGSRGRGKVTHLGSTPRGQVEEVGEGDWDQDLEFPSSQAQGAQGAPRVEMEKNDPLGIMGGATGRIVGKKTSWMSHSSIEDDNNDQPSTTATNPLTTTTTRPLREKISIDSFKEDPEDESDQVSEIDFELPSTQSHFSITPALSLATRTSLTSLRSEEPTHPERVSSIDSISTQIPSLPSQLSPAPPSSRLSIISTQSSLSAPTATSTTTTDEEDSDAEFFQDLELPSYFLGGNTTSVSRSRKERGGGGGTTTPPTSDGEFSFSEKSPSPNKFDPATFDQQQKVDLQGLLREKLELRGGRGLLFRTSSSGAESTKEQLEGLERHRETEEEEHETGKELSLSQSSEKGTTKEEGEGKRQEAEEEEKWNVEKMRMRMRTISGVRAREAAMAKNARTQGGRRTVSLSAGKLPPPLPSNSTSNSPTTMGRRSIATSRRSDTSPADFSNVPRRTPLSRSGSTASTNSLPSFPRPSFSRPSSAQATHPSSTTTRRGPPPPAPSTASRDRIRMRTISLRTVGSQSDLHHQTRITASSTTTRARAGSGGTSIDRPTPSTSTSNHPPRTASSPGPSSTPSLRPKRSQQHLRPSTAPSPGARSIERKRSLGNLNETAFSSSSRRNSLLRSPSPAASTNTTISTTTTRPSFAAPTAASSSRVRKRVHSNPPLPPSPAPPLSVVPASPVPLAASRTTPATARLLQPTLSSASKSRPSLGTPSRPSSSNHPSSTLRIPSQPPLYLSRPLTLRNQQQNQRGDREEEEEEKYGDGTELDGFDDLPVSKEREKSVLAKPRVTSSGSRASLGRVGQEQEKRGIGAAVKGREERGIMMGKKEGEKERDVKGGKKRKREPHLIRHLGAGGAGSGAGKNQFTPKIQGEMKYNPVLQRWEGNESILKEFDKVLSTSTRPALISPFSSTIGSPSRSGFSSPTLIAADLSSIDSKLDSSTPAHQPPSKLPTGGSGSSRGGVKVVGEMIFDPSTCSWYSLSGPSGEDELELDWGDVADDEQGAATGGEGDEGEVEVEDGWAQGERERMLKNRASFVLSEGGSSQDENEEDGGERRKMTKRGIWRESKRAEERCREEMRAWMTPDDGKEEDREWLFELRKLIMDSR
ncbi:uncharacterized protein JCM6883_006826 [Sporobolomyces salmoneus]|uniref:uncharacterized protein n=1 Tax=Sporobolomyces salmoneus TaxID=183962 RepID=UPI00317E8287